MVSVVAEVWKSVRLTWSAEMWLPVAAVAYAVWVGATGLAVAIATDFHVTVDPWTITTDALIASLVVAWIALPAAAATWLVRDRLTTDRGSIAVAYRLHHPLLLLGPPALLITASVLVLDRVGPAAWLLILVVYGSAWLVVRTAAFAYRVFALSLPIVVLAITFVAAASLGLAVIVLGASALGLADLIVTVANGLETRFAVAGIRTIADGEIVVRGMGLPAAVVLAVALSVGLAAIYVGLQIVAGVIARLLQPTVRRPELRAGQRYPAFARPTTGTVQTPRTPATSSTDQSTSDAAESADSDDEREPEPEPASDPEDELSYDLRNTRVYRPSEDAATVDPDLAAIADGSSECPACGTGLRDDGTCPECGSTEA